MKGPYVETINSAGLSDMLRDRASSYTYVLCISVAILFNFLLNQLSTHILIRQYCFYILQ